jgi:hypothetical protein
MLGLSRRSKVAAKVLVVLLFMLAVLGFAGKSIAPSVALPTWLLWCALGVAAFLLVLVVLIVLNWQLGQWVLRKGGTDPQWFWFPSEPRGLVALREQQRSAAKQHKK